MSDYASVEALADTVYEELRRTATSSGTTRASRRAEAATPGSRNRTTGDGASA